MTDVAGNAKIRNHLSSDQQFQVPNAMLKQCIQGIGQTVIEVFARRDTSRLLLVNLFYFLLNFRCVFTLLFQDVF
jgi:hypothetical protein